ncbi:MAG: DMT family transporter [Spirochaetota bacterium]|nr:MAG: DMT family transporter [Spirochaetota bacterium]
MPHGEHSHLKAALLAVFVTILWSSSFVLIKIGLKDIPAIIFAGIRYFLAFLILLPLVFLSKERVASVKALSLRDWIKLISLGILFYTFTQGASFIGLSLLPVVMLGIILNFTPFIVTSIGAIILTEKFTKYKLLGLGFFAIGLFFFFYPIDVPRPQLIGILVVVFGLFANSASSILGRSINREQKLHPLVVTTLSMGFGAFLLLIAGFIKSGFPALSLKNWLIILQLSVLNTALAFTLWNRSLRILHASESSIINNTMLFQVAVLGWIFLDEAMTVRQIIGMVIAGCGAIVAQIRYSKKD